MLLQAGPSKASHWSKLSEYGGAGRRCHQTVYNIQKLTRQFFIKIPPPRPRDELLKYFNPIR